jgi:hypothetical protein
MNALRSTGPKNTELTKFNALRHGLTARQLTVMPFENPEDYRRLLDGLRRDFRPSSMIEEILVEQMAQSLWRRKRILRSEKSEIEASLAEAPLKFDEQEHHRREFARYGGYGTSPPDNAAESLLDLTHVLRGNDNDPHLEILKSTAEERKKLYIESRLRPEVHPLLLRYESTLERQFYRALIMLTKIKEAASRDTGFVSQK